MRTLHDASAAGVLYQEINEIKSAFLTGWHFAEMEDAMKNYFALEDIRIILKDILTTEISLMSTLQSCFTSTNRIYDMEEYVSTLAL